MTYLDTSVLAAYYCPEALSDKAEDAIIKSATPLISQLVELELQSAVARKIREKALVKGDGVEILTRFRLHLDSGCYSRLPIESSHYDIAAAWISRFDVPLRTLDALHLAVCFDADALLLIWFDHEKMDVYRKALAEREFNRNHLGELFIDFLEATAIG